MLWAHYALCQPPPPTKSRLLAELCTVMAFFFSCIVKEKLTNCQRITFQLHVMETYKCKFPERFTRGEMMRNRFYSIWKLLIRHEHSFKLKKSSFPSFARFGGPGEKFSFQSSAFNANTVAYFHLRCLMLSGSS
jgi:hypothetical protein